jgi:selenocysteine lyase/cysteine desulfurase
MTIARRQLLGGLIALPLASSTMRSAARSNLKLDWAPEEISPRTLPDKVRFPVNGVYLDAAYTHPIAVSTQNAYVEYLHHKVAEDSRIGPGNNARDLAVGLYAKLINADPAEIAVVPSTMEGENLVVAALGLGHSKGVVTDALHYDGSLVLYGELAKQGMPLKVVAPRAGAIDLADVEAAISSETRLIAVSLVSSTTGFQYDLKALCELAHSKGAYVYADIIQAAGAVPVDVKASGVDFCSCGCYKWLMGDFGTAFLYVRPDRLAELKRVQIGWRQVRGQTSHVFPFDAPGPAIGEWTMGTGTAAMFEVSTPAWGSLACIADSLAYIESLGVEAIMQHRKPLIGRLREELPKRGFAPLTPADSAGPILVFSYKGAAARYRKALHDANIQISTYENRIRISPSIFNSMEDIEKLLGVLA